MRLIASSLFVTFAIAAASIALFFIAPVQAENKTTDNTILLAEDGHVKAVIVLPDAGRGEADVAVERMNSLAAFHLQEFLKRMSGGDFKIVRLSALDDVRIDGESISSVKVPAASYILVGESELTKKLGIAPKIAPGAMQVKAAGNTLVLMGPPDGMAYTGGTLYAAHHVLESLGIKYLWPGELGLVVPKLKDIRIPYGTHTLTPIIQQRNMRMILGGDRVQEGAKDLGIEEEYQKKIIENAKLKATYVTRSIGGWMEWHNLGGSRGISGGHSLGDLYERFGKTHPGWFALQPNGSREQKSANRARLCKSNSELIAQIAADIIAKADANPNLLSTPLSPNDGGSDAFCMCKVNALGEPGCVTYDPPEGRKINMYGWNIPHVSLTDRVMTFSNRVAEIVAKKHPNLLLVVDAYSDYSAPPVKTKLHPNLVVRYVPSTMDDWDEWSAKASKIYWRPNTLSSPWRVAELKYNKNFAEDLNYAAHHSAIATDFDSILNNWATEGLNYYVLAKLSYDPDLDSDKLIDEYCGAGFGMAASEIRRYFKRAEEVTTPKDKRMFEIYYGPKEKVVVHARLDTLPEFFTPQVLDELRGLLDAAAKKVSGRNEENETIRKRITFLRIGLDWTEIQARAYKTLIDFNKKQPVDLVAAAKLLQERRALMRKIYKENPLAINVAYINWGDRGYWRPLQKAIEDAGIKAPAAADGETEIDADEEGRPIEVPKTK